MCLKHEKKTGIRLAINPPFMLSRTQYGQRKRKREEFALLGGRRGGEEKKYDYGGEDEGRQTLHRRWNSFADFKLLHTAPADVNPDAHGIGAQRIVGWETFFPQGDPPYQPPDGWEAGRQLDAKSEGGFRHDGPYRHDEINRLVEAGTYIQALSEPGEEVDYKEALWTFSGMADSLAFGLAWSCFEYALCDLYVGGPPTVSHLLLSLQEILEDVKQVSEDRVTDDMRVYVHFEGSTEPDAGGWGGRHFLTLNGGVAGAGGMYTIGGMGNHLTQLLDRIMGFFASNEGFVFHRVFLHVLTQLGGGGLKLMPETYRKLREGPFFKGSPGFHLIPDYDDGSCGLEAIIFSMGNAMRRLVSNYKGIHKTIPSICKSFNNFKKFYEKKKSKASVFYAQFRGQLASYIGWKKDELITPPQICECVRALSREHSLNMGVLVLDAINPLVHYYYSYDPNAEKLPDEIIILILWQYPSNGGHLPSGHYDCINNKNICSWIQGRINMTKKRKDLKYSFRKFKLVPHNEADDKGLFCLFCKNWQANLSADKWGEHCGTQAENKLECEDCGVTFRGEDCFKQHKIKSYHTADAACVSQQHCQKCEKVHVNSYDCSTFYCTVCSASFPRESKSSHTCYLSYISPKKVSRIRNVIYSDMEGSRIDGQSRAACIASCWSSVCPEHNRKLTGKKTKCKACIAHTDGWEYFCKSCSIEGEFYANECKECLQEKTNFFIGKQCLDEYLDWLESDCMGSTIVFHNGGKYDLHILYLAILGTGKFHIDTDAMRGSQIIFMIATPTGHLNNRTGRHIRFIDSCAFISSALRNFPDMFDLEGAGKGRFPYDLLNKDKWEDYKGEVPDVHMFGITKKELNNIEKLSSTRGREVKEILEYIKEEKEKKEPWVALKKIREYTIDDVIVLKRGCDIFRRNFWDMLGVDPFHWVTLASAVAASFRQPQFMKESTIQIFGMEDREWQRQGLRGGKCEVFKLYWRQRKPTERILAYDINSQYPYTQGFGYFPVGKITCDIHYKGPLNFVKVAVQFQAQTGVNLIDVLHDDTGKLGCGIIECEIESGDAFFPVLPQKVDTGKSKKNMFMNFCGSWIGYINVVACAIKHRQIIITKIKRIQYWKNTSTMLFREFITTLYAAKVHATGWDKVLNRKFSKEEKYEEAQARAEYLKESRERGITITDREVKPNPGRRTTAKTSLNSPWGYMCQKPHANENLYYDNTATEDVEAMGDMLGGLDTDKNPSRMVGLPQAIGKYTKIRTTKDPKYITTKEMNKKIAYHVGGQVPAHGLVLISNAILSLHPSQVVYTDTDSIYYVYDETNPVHKKLPSGNHIGEFSDEYPDYDCVEFASPGSKSYYMKLRKKGEEKYLIKGRFKGLPLFSSVHSLLDKEGEIAKVGMDEMIALIMDAVKRLNPGEDEEERLCYEFKYTNFFKRGPDHKIRTVEEKKSIRFTFDKRDIIRPVDFKTGLPIPNWPQEALEINTKPKTDGQSLYSTAGEIGGWWVSVRERVEKEYKMYKGTDFIVQHRH